MKTIKLLLATLLLGAISVSPAWADHGHARIGVGVYLGPYWGPWYVPPPTYYYPYPSYRTVIVERPAPEVYVEQQPATVEQTNTPAPTQYWYYCAAEKGYYPYVKSCPSGWQKVLPLPPEQK